MIRLLRPRPPFDSILAGSVMPPIPIPGMLFVARCARTCAGCCSESTCIMRIAAVCRDRWALFRHFRRVLRVGSHSNTSPLGHTVLRPWQSGEDWSGAKREGRRERVGGRPRRREAAEEGGPLAGKKETGDLHDMNYAICALPDLSSPIPYTPTSSSLTICT